MSCVGCCVLIDIEQTTNTPAAAGALAAAV